MGRGFDYVNVGGRRYRFPAWTHKTIQPRDGMTRFHCESCGRQTEISGTAPLDVIDEILVAHQTPHIIDAAEQIVWQAHHG